MAASMNWFGATQLFIYFLLGLIIVTCDGLNQEYVPGVSSKSFEPGFLIAKFLDQLTKLETQLHRCAIQANAIECRIADKDDQRQSHFTFPSLSKSLEPLCDQSNDVYLCLRTESMAKSLLTTVEEDISNSVSDVCCTLQMCLTETDVGKYQRNFPTDPSDPQLWLKTCHNCALLASVKGNETIINQHIKQLAVLYNTTCTSKVLKHLNCVDLNIIALNILSGPATKKFTAAAVSMIQSCYPNLYQEPERIFTSILGELSADELMSVTSVFKSKANPTEKEAVDTVLMPKAIAGFTILIILSAISIIFAAWFIWQKIRHQIRMPNSSPNIAYSPISYHDEYLDDEGREDDDAIGAL